MSDCRVEPNPAVDAGRDLPGGFPGTGAGPGHADDRTSAGDRPRGGALSEQDERALIITRLTELQAGIGRFFARDRSMPLLASNLTMQQLKVVMFLSFHGSASGQELARHLGVGLGTVTGIVDRVVAHGLATRHEDPHDRRIRRVELSETGRRLTAEILDDGATGYRRLLEFLDTETLHTMEDIMLKLQDAMRRLRDDHSDHCG